jgi:hypothetical protein
MNREIVWTLVRPPHKYGKGKGRENGVKREQCTQVFCSTSNKGTRLYYTEGNIVRFKSNLTIYTSSLYRYYLHAP